MSNFGKCQLEDARGANQPPDCRKGDVARVWFYRAERYGVVISPPEQIMSEEWSMMDPVSSWEVGHERRITEIFRVPNRFLITYEAHVPGSTPAREPDSGH